MSHYAGRSLSIVLSLGHCSKESSLIHHVMFQGRNQKSISFQGLSDGDRNNNNNNNKIPQIGAGLEQSWQQLLRGHLFYLFITCQGRKEMGTKSEKGFNKASTTCPYLENICEEYKENLTRNKVCYQLDGHVNYLNWDPLENTRGSINNYSSRADIDQDCPRQFKLCIWSLEWRCWVEIYSNFARELTDPDWVPTSSFLSSRTSKTDFQRSNN